MASEETLHAMEISDSGDSLKQRAVGDGEALELDAGALFVLESKGNWKHAAFHLTASIAGFPILSLPYAFVSLGWVWGTISLVMGALVSLYAYTLISTVLEHCANQGRRHVRYRDLADEIVGRRVATYFVGPFQMVVCLGSVIACILFGGISIKTVYFIVNPNGSLKLYQCISMVGAAMVILGQLPSFHSLRHINLIALLVTVAFSGVAAVASIYIGHSKHAPPRDYKLPGSDTQKLFGAFNSLAIIATTYGNSLIPEIQGTLAPPVSGKMFKGLVTAYAVICSVFFSVAFSGYWAFGNLASGNLFSNFDPSDGQKLVPDWVVLLGNVLTITEVLALALVYSQPLFDILETRTATVSESRFSTRNMLPRLIVRTILLAVMTLLAAMFPFFGDIVAILGAFGFTPLDFVIPMLLYVVVFKPPKSSIRFWGNVLISAVYSGVGVLGGIASIRQLVLNVTKYKLFADL